MFDFKRKRRAYLMPIFKILRKALNAFKKGRGSRRRSAAGKLQKFREHFEVLGSRLLVQPRIIFMNPLPPLKGISLK